MLYFYQNSIFQYTVTFYEEMEPKGRHLKLHTSHLQKIGSHVTATLALFCDALRYHMIRYFKVFNNTIK